MASAIYAINTAAPTVAAGGTIPLTTIVRRTGSAVNLVNNAVQMRQTGYYQVEVTAVVLPTVAGVEEITLLKDGVAVPGAVSTGTAATASDATALSISALVRNTACCCADPSTLTVNLAAAGVVSNIGMVVTKL